MSDSPRIGVVSAGVVHSGTDDIDIYEKFRMVRDAGVFDYFDVTPPAEKVHLYAQASEKYGIPIAAGGCYYRFEQGTDLLKAHIQNCSILGTTVHNVQIMAEDVRGNLVTDQEVASLFLEVADFGASHGVTCCFEVHVNMWSEHFGRVQKVANLVELQGVKFSLTLDPSHIIVKINNPIEAMVQGMDVDIEAERLILDPYRDNNICQGWMASNYVRHAHARSAVVNGPINVWAHHPDGRPGRAIQYPFLKPKAGEWHSAWSEERLEPWKEIFRQLFRYHARNESSPLTTVSTEFIPYPDYGGGAKYSLFEQNVACAQWLRDTWHDEASLASHERRTTTR